MKKIGLGLTIFGLFIFYTSFAINSKHKIDSLLKLLKTDKEDTNKVKHLTSLCWHFRVIGKMDTALWLGNEALILAGKTGFLKGKASAYTMLGVVYWNQGFYPKALENYYNALKIYEETANETGIGIITGNIGIVYYNQGDYPRALENYFKALKIKEKSGNKIGVELLYEDIGTVYEARMNYSLALDYLLKALKIGEELKNSSGIARAANGIGNVYYHQNNYNKALDYFLKGAEVSEKTGDKTIIAANSGDIGKVLLKQKKYKEAERYFLQGLVIAEEIHLLESVKEFNLRLSILYEETGQFQKSYNRYKKYTLEKDSLFNLEKNKEMTRFEMNYEFEKKENAVRAEQERKDAVAKEEKQKQQIITYAIAGILFLAIVFSLFLFNRFKVTQKQKKVIEEQKEQVDAAYESLHERNKEVMDSIFYARRIQKALITSEKYIQNRLSRLIKK